MTVSDTLEGLNFKVVLFSLQVSLFLIQNNAVLLSRLIHVIYTDLISLLLSISMRKSNLFDSYSMKFEFMQFACKHFQFV